MKFNKLQVGTLLHQRAGGGDRLTFMPFPYNLLPPWWIKWKKNVFQSMVDTPAGMCTVSGFTFVGALIFQKHFLEMPHLYSIFDEL